MKNIHSSDEILPHIILDETGVIYEFHGINGKFHRDPAAGPAFIRRRVTGVITNEEFWLRYERHRDPTEGPAVITRDPATGAVTHMAFFLNNMLHRDPADGPAWIERDAVTDVVIYESYWLHDMLHRDLTKGPAVIRRDAHTGAVTSEEYWLDGERTAEPSRAGQQVERRHPRRRRLSSSCDAL